MAKVRQSRHALEWLKRGLGGKRYKILLLTLLSAGMSGIALAYAWLFRSLIDSAVAGDGTALTRAVALLLLALSGQIALRAWGRHLEEDSRSGIENTLKARLFHCLLFKEYAAISSTHSGEWMNRLTSDTRIVADHLVDLLPSLTGMMIRLVGAVIMLLILQPGFAVVLVPGGILLIGITFLFRRKLKALHKDIQEKDGALRIFLQERLGSLMVLRAFGREKHAEADAKGYMAAHRDARMKRNRFSNLCNVGFGAVMNGAYIGSAIYCAFGILRGTISFGTMTAIMQLVSQVQNPFANLSGLLPRFYAMVASAERLMEAESLSEDCAANRKTEEEITAFYRERFEGIALRDISFAYPSSDTEHDGRLALRHCDLRLQKRTCTGIVGPSGCGKSSLFKLLMAFYTPNEGERLLLGNDGERALDSTWRGLFAYVPQGNHLMQGTIREAVAFGDPEGMRKDQRLMQALHIACADGFVSALPEGLDTMLGEHGAGLSEGQLQRLAIARALFTDRPVLLLDECTSSLDEETERELLNRLKLLTDKTVLIITHRKAALAITDQLIECRENEGYVTWIQKSKTPR